MIKREDVIFDPEDPRVEGLIGKPVMFSDIFSALREAPVIGELRLSPDKKDPYPFRQGLGSHYAMIYPIPEPAYRPFRSAKEFEPFREKWAKYKTPYTCVGEEYLKAGWYSNERVMFLGVGSAMSYEDAFRNLEHEDGTPFGIKENNHVR